MNYYIILSVGAVLASALIWILIHRNIELETRSSLSKWTTFWYFMLSTIILLSLITIGYILTQYD